MKKSISILLSLLMLISVCTVFASAAGLKNGMYKVPLLMLKADSDEESLAAKFLETNCYMEVKGGKKTLYIPLREDIKNPMMGTMSEEDKAKVEFFYYVDGKIDKENGKTEPCERMENVSVDGVKHTYVFKVPMVLENDIGLLFKAPGMPSFVTPAARLRLNLGAVIPCGNVVSANAAPTEAPADTQAPAVTEAPKATSAPVATEAVASTQAASTDVTVEDTTAAVAGGVSDTTAVESTTAAATEESGSSIVPMVIIGVVIALAIAIGITVTIVVVQNKKAKQNFVEMPTTPNSIKKKDKEEK